ncbi:hypothetical protein T11_2897 [Trichinella zimbabwensis]|uniref:Uncharacterized protein n=1 Tax=Trichinella zimbabwensis TaxID=268475 RepID=A0A0V1HQ55_9BILA|nr:hypothetical protein T11_2897 [Trichinella zimbabwensis]
MYMKMILMKSCKLFIFQLEILTSCNSCAAIINNKLMNRLIYLAAANWPFRKCSLRGFFCKCVVARHQTKLSSRDGQLDKNGIYCFTIYKVKFEQEIFEQFKRKFEKSNGYLLGQKAFHSDSYVSVCRCELKSIAALPISATGSAAASKLEPVKLQDIHLYK